MSKKILLPIANGFEEIEAVTIIDLLRRANINVTVASINELIVKGAHNINIEANTIFNHIDKSIKYDAIVIPGGGDCAQNLGEHKELCEFLKICFKNNILIAAICASPALVLAKNGFIDSLRATCYPSLKNYIPCFIDQNIVLDKNVLTAKGPALAIEFSLKIIENLLSIDVSKKIAKDILYNEYCK